MSYTLALGPFDTAWRGPQRLVLKLNGDQVADVEYRVGYNERGCAERIPRLNLEQGLQLVTRICGTCSHAHTLAFCQAIEQLWGIAVPPRASYLRCALAELERLRSHLDTLTALFATIGQERLHAALHDQSVQARELMRQLSGQPIFPDMCLPGGVWRDVDDQQRMATLTQLARLNRRLFQLVDRVIDQRALLARTVDVGVLSQNAASQFGLRGPMARASGLQADLRLDEPYAAYHQLPPRLVVQEGGDVYARMVVLLLECIESAKLTEQALQNLPEGDWQGSLPATLAAGQASAGVEAPRGALRYSVESDGRRLTAVTIDPPRQLDRLLARTLLSNALLDNVVLIVLSADPCTACAEC